MRQSHKTIILWILLAMMVLFIYQLVAAGNRASQEKDFSTFMSLLEDGAVSQVVIKGNQLTVTKKDSGDKFQTYGLVEGKLVDTLIAKEVRIKFEKEEATPFWQSALITWLPMLVLLFLFIFFLRQLQAGGGKAMAFGKSKAKLLTEHSQRVTFKDVAGADEAKEELEEIIAFLKDPKKFMRLGGRIPKGVLLMGPPGTGKTLLARAIAGEAQVPFFSISGSDFVEMFVGVGASRVRDLFEQGKKNAPCIIFVDEIDAVGRHRGAGLGGGHDEREQTLNQLLVEMDGFESNDSVILIAATNRPDVLDPALLRPGRFDRRVIVPRPDVRGREGILGVHTKKVPLSDDVNLAILARGTPGCSGADLQNLVNEAALLAARRDADKVAMTDFESAKDKVLLGVERKSKVMSDEQKRGTAYHEAGHALLLVLLPNTHPLHKVTIIPRGMALGLTHYLPEEELDTMEEDFALDQIAVCMGGRIAEEIFFGKLNTGAHDDIDKATRLARAMVCEWGMSKKLGPLTFGQKDGEVFLGRDMTQRTDFSATTGQLIDEEVRRIVVENYDRAREVLEANKAKLEEVAEALLEFETLEGIDVEQIINDTWSGTPRELEGQQRRLEAQKSAEAPKTEARPEPATEDVPLVPPGGMPEPSGA